MDRPDEVRTMSRKREPRGVWLGAVAVGVLTLSGCVEYTIETTVAADGSGARQEELTVHRAGRNRSDTALRRLFGQLTSVTAAARWSHDRLLEDGDTVHRFRRQTAVPTIDDWAALSNTVRIAGAVRADSATRLGSVRLGDVRFRNTAAVEDHRAGPDRSLTYRETFVWDNLAQVLVEYLASSYVSRVADAAPSIAPDQRRELTSLVSGSVWFAVGRGLFDASGADEETIVSTLARTVARHTVAVLGPDEPGSSLTAFADLLRATYDDEEAFERQVLTLLPGMALSIKYEIVVRLTMPGTVTETNAHRREGRTLIWEFTPGDALTAPLEIVARSVVER